MNLQKCPACENECSVLAPSCPRCGHPFNQSENQRSFTDNSKAKTNHWKILMISLGVAMILGLTVFVLLHNRSDAQPALNPASDNSFVGEQQPAMLDIEAGIDYSIGGVQPVTSQTFFLLDSDLEQILRRSGMKADPKLGSIGRIGSFALNSRYRSDSEEHKKALEAIKKHIKYTATTDLKGKANFSKVKPGTFYIFGLTETRGGFAVWNLKIDLKEGANSQILDTTNASIAF